MKILLLGGSGTLGTELKKLTEDICAPDSSECNVLDYEALEAMVQDYQPDVILHAAAYTDNRLVEQNPEKAVAVNIVGTCNVSIVCAERNIRLVYISTDYVYPGDRGNYLEEDPVRPFNLYAWTKLGGECAVRAVENHLIVRTSFGRNKFEYPQAFVDKWVSKDYVDVIAPMILEATLSPLTGVLNLGTERKTLYDYAQRRDTSVQPVRIRDSNFHTPYDTSLNLQKWRDHKVDAPVARQHTHCRCCGSVNLVKYLDLGLMPLANNLEFTAQRAKTKERYPLQVMLCEVCNLSQLSVVINPKELFAYYTYRSGINKGYIQHCEAMARRLLSNLVWEEGDLHIDIAGNDGTLLKCFSRTWNGSKHYNCVNIDPATNLTAIAEGDGIRSITNFWSLGLAQAFVGQARLITATNVFAHVDDIQQFLQACQLALTADGVVVLEFPYIMDFITNGEFDTVYFEHLSYMSLNPISFLCNDLGLEVIDAEHVDIHGGSLRVTIANNGMRAVKTRVRELVESESKYLTLSGYKAWAGKVHESIYQAGTQLLELRRQGKTIAGFAASAKGNTLLNCLGVTTDIMMYIADETPEKIGKYSPGTGIPIVNKQQILINPPDYIVILSWNFLDDIILKLRTMGFTGQFIAPIPTFQIL